MPKKRVFHLIGLDETGSLILDEKTVEAWSISELQSMFDQAKKDLYTGKLKQVIIERI